MGPVDIPGRAKRVHPNVEALLDGGSSLDHFSRSDSPILRAGTAVGGRDTLLSFSTGGCSTPLASMDDKRGGELLQLQRLGVLACTASFIMKCNFHRHASVRACCFGLICRCWNKNLDEILQGAGELAKASWLGRRNDAHFPPFKISALVGGKPLFSPASVRACMQTRHGCWLMWGRFRNVQLGNSWEKRCVRPEG